jgi:hypothetical protein
VIRWLRSRRLLLAELDGLRRSEAKQKRRASRLAEVNADLQVKAGSYRHEIKKLENVLLWIHRTSQDLDEIRRVVERVIPKAVARRPRIEP